MKDYIQEVTVIRDFDYFFGFINLVNVSLQFRPRRVLQSCFLHFSTLRYERPLIQEGNGSPVSFSAKFYLASSCTNLSILLWSITMKKAFLLSVILLIIASELQMPFIMSPFLEDSSCTLILTRIFAIFTKLLTQKFQQTILFNFYLLFTYLHFLLLFDHQYHSISFLFVYLNILIMILFNFYIANIFCYL